jgi:hypothetical protein
MAMYPSDLAACAPLVRVTLLAELCWARKAEMIDGLVELLIQLVHDNARFRVFESRARVSALAVVPALPAVG